MLQIAVPLKSFYLLWVRVILATKKKCRVYGVRIETGIDCFELKMIHSENNIKYAQGNFT